MDRSKGGRRRPLLILGPMCSSLTDLGRCLPITALGAQLRRPAVTRLGDGIKREACLEAGAREGEITNVRLGNLGRLSPGFAKFASLWQRRGELLQDLPIPRLVGVVGSTWHERQRSSFIPFPCLLRCCHCRCCRTCLALPGSLLHPKVPNISRSVPFSPMAPIAEPGNVTVRQILITYLFRREGGVGSPGRTIPTQCLMFSKEPTRGWESSHSPGRGKRPIARGSRSARLNSKLRHNLACLN